MRDSASASRRQPREFPSTCWTVIRDAGDEESPSRKNSIENLFSIYWRPVYAYLRRKWNKPHEEAKDLTQDFFAAFYQKDIFCRLSPEQGRFRSYVMSALDNFVISRHRFEGRLKRGGGREILPLRLEKGFEPSGDGTPEEVFQREWARAVLADALREMRTECQTRGNLLPYEIVRLRDVEVPQEIDLSYRGLARRFGIRETDVTNHLHRGRRLLRELVLRRVRDTVVSPDEAEAEMRLLFGRTRT